MGLPFVVAQFGRADLSAPEVQLAATARRAAMRQDDWLANSVSNKTAAVDRLPGGELRFRQEYYTFFGVPWGWSEVTVDAQGRVVQIDTKLTVGSDVRSVRPPQLRLVPCRARARRRSATPPAAPRPSRLLRTSCVVRR